MNKKGVCKKSVIALMLLTSVFALVFLISNVSANKLYCLSDGEQLPPNCAGSSCRYTCDLRSGQGFCEICTTNSGIPGVNPATCNGKKCDFMSGGGGENTLPPNMTLISPQNGTVFTVRSIPLKFTITKNAAVFYMNLLESRQGRWNRICTSCSSYDQNRRFNEGYNSIRIRATDHSGNEVFKDVAFFIDSKVPKIRKTFPGKNEFANGDFRVEIQEDNPRELKLIYGDSSSMKTQVLNLNSCVIDKTKRICDVNVNLAMFDGKEIQYHFTLKDVAGNMVESPGVPIKVDNTAPILVNTGNYTHLEGEYRYFHLQITEPNFEGVVYSYLDTRGNIKEKKICTKLDESGMCVKRIKFRSGHYDLTVTIKDQAGNSVGYPLVFDVA